MTDPFWAERLAGQRAAAAEKRSAAAARRKERSTASALAVAKATAAKDAVWEVEVRELEAQAAREAISAVLEPRVSAPAERRALLEKALDDTSTAARTAALAAAEAAEVERAATRVLAEARGQVQAEAAVDKAFAARHSAPRRRFAQWGTEAKASADRAAIALAEGKSTSQECQGKARSTAAAAEAIETMAEAWMLVLQSDADAISGPSAALVAIDAAHHAAKAFLDECECALSAARIASQTAAEAAISSAAAADSCQLPVDAPRGQPLEDRALDTCNHTCKSGSGTR